MYDYLKTEDEIGRLAQVNFEYASKMMAITSFLEMYTREYIMNRIEIEKALCKLVLKHIDNPKERARIIRARDNSINKIKNFEASLNKHMKLSTKELHRTSLSPEIVELLVDEFESFWAQKTEYESHTINIKTNRHGNI